MIKKYFIADLHLGHENMATNRGFENAEHMFEVIKKNWNAKVRKNDTVYILGDVTMEKKKGYELLDQLIGNKRIVLGNHDRRQDVPELLKHCKTVSGMEAHKGIFLTHCPVHPMEFDYRVKKNLHGHIHSKIVKRGFLGIKFKDKRYVNVSCEQVNYTPMTLEELGIKI